jgi:hypothetical protein
MTGSICGERVQKNFPTELMARTFMNGLIAAANQGESSRTRFIGRICRLTVKQAASLRHW